MQILIDSYILEEIKIGFEINHLQLIEKRAYG